MARSGNLKAAAQRQVPGEQRADPLEGVEAIGLTVDHGGDREGPCRCSIEPAR